ncbi:hypothetical protein [Catenulispora subtropica]|uniref:Uncharacterized protein n=1 Tax=Catenulispora subtropica TaxID=450798 RepID=A0ABN2RIQ6_9ACTN
MRRAGDSRGGAQCFGSVRRGSAAGVGDRGGMLVDASYLAWVRPARRVHYALSVGMTLTGVILATFGIIGSRSAAPVAPVVDRVDRSADTSVAGNVAGSVVVPAPPTAAPAPPAIVPAPAPPPAVTPAPPATTDAKAHAKPNPKPKPRPRPVPAPPAESAVAPVSPNH